MHFSKVSISNTFNGQLTPVAFSPLFEGGYGVATVNSAQDLIRGPETCRDMEMSIWKHIKYFKKKKKESTILNYSHPLLTCLKKKRTQRSPEI